MSNNAKNSTTTPADVAKGKESNDATDALIEESKAARKTSTTVPAQAEGEKAAGDVSVEETTESEKKSFKDRFASLTEKLKANKKTVIGVTAAVSVAALAFAKIVKQKALEAGASVEYDEDDTTVDTDVDESA